MSSPETTISSSLLNGALWSSETGGNHVYVKCVFLGDMFVGKTSLLNQYISKKFQKRYKATLGADFFVQEILIGDVIVVLQIWDTAGQERFRSLGTSYFHGADICCLVFDVSNRESFEHVQTWHDYFLSQMSEDQAEEFPFIIIGNKIDKPVSERAVSSAEAERFCRQLGMGHPYFEASAKSGFNLDDIFTTIATITLQRKETEPTEPSLQPVELEEQKPSGCC
ncbi:Rab7b [Monocercomonoides exilis]|uniref:Rab7b n=1 Tax=Monocercomonoides exilis TaxID=2049356 RepID=UPI0035597675|nr:Rab7b [Monocercomonoides exilis]|eukprot:MONOS_12143.1-p1 / transcript=MONOS_12143.1 / gene=MONOS_12143 / organism=Monocercomonoides_exilis_PA203 / gene_product=Rab7b / transcript_product=Rab7b / location=Mono_scaffold00652:3192-4352(-) / protein_length=224 / sequence_SO=supercontig / SO=protein_coding / is_pseudo=false